MRVLFVGDVHANTAFLKEVYSMAERYEVDRVFQVGDFGWWPRMPTGERFINAASSLATKTNIPLIFVDGNHEDHSQLPHDGEVMQELKPGLHYLARGVVITLGNARVLGHGGAVSVDQAWRTEHIDWFREEVANHASFLKSIDAKNVDVVVAHDVPAGTDLRLTFPVTPSIDAHCKQHRDSMLEILETHDPYLWVAGHYHQRVTQRIGNTTVEVLDGDGTTNLSKSTLLVEEFG